MYMVTIITRTLIPQDYNYTFKKLGDKMNYRADLSRLDMYIFACLTLAAYINEIKWMWLTLVTLETCLMKSGLWVEPEVVNPGCNMTSTPQRTFSGLLKIVIITHMFLNSNITTKDETCTGLVWPVLHKAVSNTIQIIINYGNTCTCM